MQTNMASFFSLQNCVVTLLKIAGINVLNIFVCYLKVLWVSGPGCESLVIFASFIFNQKLVSNALYCKRALIYQYKFATNEYYCLQ